MNEGCWYHHFQRMNWSQPIIEFLNYHIYPEFNPRKDQYKVTNDRPQENRDKILASLTNICTIYWRMAPPGLLSFCLAVILELLIQYCILIHIKLTKSQVIETFQTRKRLYNRKCPSVCQSVCHKNPKASQN